MKLICLDKGPMMKQVREYDVYFRCEAADVVLIKKNKKKKQEDPRNYYFPLMV